LKLLEIGFQVIVGFVSGVLFRLFFFDRPGGGSEQQDQKSQSGHSHEQIHDAFLLESRGDELMHSQGKKPACCHVNRSG